MPNAPFKHAASAGTLLAMVSALLLGGCGSYRAALGDDEYVPVAHYERYPIEVEKRPVKMELGTRAGTLKPGQINELAGFVDQAQSNSANRIFVKRPSGGGRSIQVAKDVRRFLVLQGIPEAMIVSQTYPGASTGPVQVGYVKKVAVTRECGDWSDNWVKQTSNQTPSNFGCATQNNIAAMVANPEDFEKPRASDPAYAVTRTTSDNFPSFETANNVDDTFTLNINTNE